MLFGIIQSSVFFRSVEEASAPEDVEGLMYHYDISQMPVVADATTVQTIMDFSGNGRHLTQSNASARAAYKVNLLNGLPILRFDGTRSYDSVGGKADINWMHQGDSTIFWVVKSNSDSTTHTLFDSNGGSAANIGRVIQFNIVSSGNNGSMTDLITAGGGLNVINNKLPETNSTPQGEWLVIVLRIEFGKLIEHSTIEVNNVLKSPSNQLNTPSASPSTLDPRWFSRSSYANRFNGDFAVGFGYNRALSDNEIRSLVGGVNNNYGI